MQNTNVPEWRTTWDVDLAAELDGSSSILKKAKHYFSINTNIIDSLVQVTGGQEVTQVTLK